MGDTLLFLIINLEFPALFAINGFVDTPVMFTFYLGTNKRSGKI